MQIRALHPDDDRGSFASGDPDIDRYFQQFAGQNQFRHHVGVTSVAVADGVIVGYVSLLAASIEIESLPQKARRRLPRYPAPVLRLARMGVDAAHQGKGIGDRLIEFVFDEALDMAERYGCIGLVVDAKEGAVGFYERYGFRSLEVVSGELLSLRAITPMFLSLKALPGYGED
jgi:GNAT superfamily N-acetyltransferase